MTHPVQFKLLLLLTFAVWVHQCAESNSKKNSIINCCNFGRIQVKSHCEGSDIIDNYLEMYSSELKLKCKRQIKSCCHNKRESDECNNGMKAALTNMSNISNTSSKFKSCYHSCLLGLEIAKKGNDCNTTILNEERLEINPTKKCCMTRQNELLITDEEETNEASADDEDDYDNDSLEDNESSFEVLETSTLVALNPTTYRQYANIEELRLFENDISSTKRSGPKLRNQLFEDKTQNYLSLHKSENSVIFPESMSEKYPYKNQWFHSSTLKPTYQEAKSNWNEKPVPCSNGVRHCDHSCIMIYGYKQCLCNKGYILHSNGRTCLKMNDNKPILDSLRKPCEPGKFWSDFNGCLDIDECKIKNNRCGENAVCKNIEKGYMCIYNPEVCGVGYRFNKVKMTCDDINECKEDAKICASNQICLNTVGSYICRDSCDSLKERCNLFYNQPSELVAPTTISTSSISCPKGFQLNARGICADIDECISNPCSPHLKCRNYNGGYRCEATHCKKGFRINGKQCDDIDECRMSNSSLCPVTHNCKNTYGSYTCRMKYCPAGYKLDHLGNCVDVNECHIYKNICRNADCVNTIGSFNCKCKVGFKETSKNYCGDINECIEGIDGCSQRCSNTIGSFACKCDNGYKLESDGKTCVDIDECKEKIDNCRNKCVNTLGSYKCECPDGFILEGEFICKDINECKDNPNICESNTTRCLNTIGSYKCISNNCKSDYKLIRKDKHKYCSLKTVCGDDDYDVICKKPWMYDQYIYSMAANSSIGMIMSFSISKYNKYNITIDEVRPYNVQQNVKAANLEDFNIIRSNNEFYVKVKPIDGPQDIDVDIRKTFFRPDGQIVFIRGIELKIAVSGYSYNRFSNRK